MPMYRSGLDMYKKYEKKFNPTVIGTRFTDIADLAKERAQEGLIFVGTIRDLIRPILDAHGITGGLRATYLAFGLAVARHVSRQPDEAGKKIVSGLKSYFVTAYDLDPTICDEIIQVVAGWAVTY